MIRIIFKQDLSQSSQIQLSSHRKFSWINRDIFPINILANARID